MPQNPLAPVVSDMWGMGKYPTEALKRGNHAVAGAILRETPV